MPILLSFRIAKIRVAQQSTEWRPVGVCPIVMVGPAVLTDVAAPVAPAREQRSVLREFVNVSRNVTDGYAVQTDAVVPAAIVRRVHIVCPTDQIANAIRDMSLIRQQHHAFCLADRAEASLKSDTVNQEQTDGCGATQCTEFQHSIV